MPAGKFLLEIFASVTGKNKQTKPQTEVSLCFSVAGFPDLESDSPQLRTWRGQVTGATTFLGLGVLALTKGGQKDALPGLSLPGAQAPSLPSSLLLA